jgi:hypothetical protein
VEIVIRCVPDCPHCDEAQRRVREALGGRAASVVMEVVADYEVADTLQFCGSPTVLIDGVDVVSGDGPVGLSCRVYHTETGREGAPSVAQLREAIREARK